MTDWTKEEEEAFNDVEKHSNLGKQILRDLGQPYHYDVFVSVSQRNQVIEECAKVADEFKKQTLMDWPDQIAEALRKLKK